MPQNLLNQVISISSGTLATLTGKRLYSEIEIIHNEFIAYFITNQNKYSEVIDWKTIWLDYKKSRGL
jgi:hypothetical protein